jgi:2-amino-4-hydroxy-6-hydroxymethyldihydropteridine diphosphokinase
LVARVFIAVGSNIAPENNIIAGLRLLDMQVKLVAISTFYHTTPIGPPGQPDFVNGVVEIETELTTQILRYEVLRPLEAKLGRVRTADKYAPRSLDLDLLLAIRQGGEGEEIEVFDQELARRSFLAMPLAELSPDLILPGSGRLLRQLAESFQAEELTPLPQLTAMLKKELGDES